MSAKVMTIVLATQNPGKLAELRAFFAALPIEVVSVQEVAPSYVAPAEDGATFEENALKKARAAAEATQLVAVADDSGLEVDALSGRPGVRSARFAREGATDSENNAALLSQLGPLDDPERGARFRCVIALVDPFSEAAAPLCFEGRCEGRIARDPRGKGGFGYDPLFVLAGGDRTFAELTEEEKSRISHRAKAVSALLPSMEQLVNARLAEARHILARRATA